MKLNDYMRKNNLTERMVAAELRIKQQSVNAYRRGVVIPRKEPMRRLFRMSGGQVQPNDFYDLPKLRDGAAAARQAHNLEVAGSDPAPATTSEQESAA